MRTRGLLRAAAFLSAGALAQSAAAAAQSAHSAPPAAGGPSAVLSEIDRRVREGFWDPNLKGVDWTAAVARASATLTGAATAAERDTVFDRLLATLDDSHTFRVPAGRLPETNWATAGLRIGRDGDGYAVKGVIPESAADRLGMKPGDRVTSIAGIPYGGGRPNFRDLFLALEGRPGASLEIGWRPAVGPPRTSRLTLEPEPPGDALVWKSARVIRRGGKSYGYVRLWGMSSETALAVVDLLSDRVESARAKPELSGFDAIEGVLLDIRGNSGGYDPNILPTFLRGRWNAGDYWISSRGTKRLVPPEYQPLPVALLVNSGTASAGEALALKFRRHGIGPIVGEDTAGMLSAGASFTRLSDGSSLWLSERAVSDADGRSYEGRGVAPDVSIPDRPPAAAGEEDRIVEAAVRELQKRAASPAR